MNTVDMNKLTGAIEAILFASGEPIAAARIAQALDIETSDVLKILTLLRDRYEAPDSGLSLYRFPGDEYQLCTHERYAEPVKAALDIKRNTLLTPAALEALAIIAYNQPVTKAFVEQVRGVDSGSVVNTLVEKGLVEERGRLDVPGRPVSYGTTQQFLRVFSLSGIDELPSLPEPQMRLENGEAAADMPPESAEALPQTIANDTPQ